MAWTDDPLTEHSTKIKAIHIEELRDAIEDLQNETCPTDNTTYNSSKDNTVNGTRYTSVNSSYYNGNDATYNNHVYHNESK